MWTIPQDQTTQKDWGTSKTPNKITVNTIHLTVSCFSFSITNLNFPPPPYKTHSPRYPHILYKQTSSKHSSVYTVDDTMKLWTITSINRRTNFSGGLMREPLALVPASNPRVSQPAKDGQKCHAGGSIWKCTSWQVNCSSTHEAASRNRYRCKLHKRQAYDMYSKFRIMFPNLNAK